MARAKQIRKRMVIADDMTIYNAAVHKEKLLQAIAVCHELEVDLTKIGEMDTAGMQVLMLAKREADRHSKVMHLTGRSEAVGEMIELFNLVEHFGERGGQSERKSLE